MDRKVAQGPDINKVRAETIQRMSNPCRHDPERIRNIRIGIQNPQEARENLEFRLPFLFFDEFSLGVFEAEVFESGAAAS